MLEKHYRLKLKWILENGSHYSNFKQTQIMKYNFNLIILSIQCIYQQIFVCLVTKLQSTNQKKYIFLYCSFRLYLNRSYIIKCITTYYKYIKKIQMYTMDICIDIFSKSDYSLKLRNAICQLFINLWVDRPPFNKLNLPNYI